jgi:cytochrome c nitrite reductase small subunit
MDALMKLKFSTTVLLAVIAGTLIGVGGYTFIYAKGYSYLSSDPAACANCHVMRGQFDAWSKSSHHSAATCNDCHTPHNLIGKYAVKASNGFFHSFFFTTGLYPDNIEITRRNHRVTEAACRHCHQSVVYAIDTAHGKAAGVECTRCHSSVGHSESAASVTYPDKLGSLHDKR